jgi:hypothetical protein
VTYERREEEAYFYMEADRGFAGRRESRMRLFTRKTDSSREKIMPRLHGLLEVGAAEERTL